MRCFITRKIHEAFEKSNPVVMVCASAQAADRRQSLSRVKRKFKNAVATSSEIHRKSGSRPETSRRASRPASTFEGANSTVNKAGPSNYRRPSVKSSIPGAVVGSPEIVGTRDKARKRDAKGGRGSDAGKWRERERERRREPLRCRN